DRNPNHKSGSRVLSWAKPTAGTRSATNSATRYTNPTSNAKPANNTTAAASVTVASSPGRGQNAHVRSATTPRATSLPAAPRPSTPPASEPPNAPAPSSATKTATRAATANDHGIYWAVPVSIYGSPTATEGAARESPQDRPERGFVRHIPAQ